MKPILCASAVLLSAAAQAGVAEAVPLIRGSQGSVRRYPEIARHLAADGLYYAAVPYVKEYLARVPVSRGGRAGSFDALVDKVASRVGIKQFEVMPTKFLERSGAPTLRYILARKRFRQGDHDGAMASLGGRIPRNHPTKPFALLLEGTILSIQKRHEAAHERFRQCVSMSGGRGGAGERRQLRINRDSCLAGIARNHFAAKQFRRADLAYLDIDKSSPVWPEILFEEAWSSFYRGNHNRTLGKLVTYKAPVLASIHNPEIDVLRALSYMELCLWDDAQKVVDEFYEKYSRGLSSLRRLSGRSLKSFYLMARDGLSRASGGGAAAGDGLVGAVVRSLGRDSAYQELNRSFQEGKKEVERVGRIRDARARAVLTSNLRDSLGLQRSLIGGYVRKVVANAASSVDRMMQGMSYIKLEVLSRQKASLYEADLEGGGDGRGRGRLKYLERNDKQYFWTFNGEFWADELGDYVFALGSECRA